MTRDEHIAQHEAAHVVVGVSLGLRLRWARIYPPHHKSGNAGETKFAGTLRLMAHGIMFAAGEAWERCTGDKGDYGRGDRQLARDCLRTDLSRADLRAAVLCAEALLHSRMALHARVSRLLAERDITGADVAELIERLG